MEVSLSESFLEDFSLLPRGLTTKCRAIMRDLRVGGLSGAAPGWRLHKLRSTRYHSISLDMNYRMLVEVRQNALIIHRAVKHDLADADWVNQQATSPSDYTLNALELPISSIYSSALEFGIPSDQLEPLRGCETEDDLLEALEKLPPAICDLVISLHEISQVQIPRARFVSLGPNDDLEDAATIGGAFWNLYLHPSQEYIVGLPAPSRTVITGSAGTGKSVCAWKRFEWLLLNGRSVGFVTPSDSALAVSKQTLSEIANQHDQPSYFLVPRNMDELSQLFETVDHVVVDEGQEIPPNWYQAVGKVLRGSNTGLTFFSDLNQLGGNIPNNDWRRYENRIQRWKTAVALIPECSHLVLAVNYRNSKEIANHYMELVDGALPRQFRSELPAFSGDPVAVHQTSVSRLPEQVAMIVRRLSAEYQFGDVAVVYLPGTNVKDVREELHRTGIPSNTDMSQDTVAVVKSDVARGHERRAVVLIRPTVERTLRNYGTAIEAYIGASRAINTLVVMEVS